MSSGHGFGCPSVDPAGRVGCTLLAGHVGLCRNVAVQWCGYCALPDGAHRQDCPTHQTRAQKLTP